MKKFGLVGLALIIALAIYYFTIGTTQIATQMKATINTQLASLQKQGFSVENREVLDRKEHFILSFNEPEKVIQFFNAKGIRLYDNDAEAFQGLKIGVDVYYAADTYSSVSFDMYPVALPHTIRQAFELEENKDALLRINKMLKEKTFFTHLSIAKLGSGFKGYMKDINESFEDKENIKIAMEGLTFSGNIKKNKIEKIKQNIKSVSLEISNEIKILLSNMKTKYSMTGDTKYDYSTEYSMEKMSLKRTQDFSLEMNNIDMRSVSTTKDGLASGTLESKVKDIVLSQDTKKIALKDTTFAIKADNLDMSAFKKLQEVDPNNDKQIKALLQELISKGIQVSISKFAINKLEVEEQKMDGFTIDAKVNIDKTLNIASLEKNPILAMSAIDASINLNLSNELFTFIAQEPKVMMAAMIFRPKDINGKKEYTLKLENSKLTVNGMPVM